MGITLIRYEWEWDEMGRGKPLWTGSLVVEEANMNEFEERTLRRRGGNQGKVLRVCHEYQNKIHNHNFGYNT